MLKHHFDDGTQAIFFPDVQSLFLRVYESSPPPQTLAHLQIQRTEALSLVF